MKKLEMLHNMSIKKPYQKDPQLPQFKHTNRRFPFGLPYFFTSTLLKSNSKNK